MICNDSSLRDSTLHDLKSIWPHMLINKLEKNRNEILFCSQQPKDQLFQKNAIKDKNDKKLEKLYGKFFIVFYIYWLHKNEIYF